MAEAPLQTSRWRSLAQFFAQVAPECLSARRAEFITDVIAKPSRRRYRAIEIIDGVRGPEHSSLPDDYWRMGEMAWHWSTLTFETQSFFIEVLVEVLVEEMSPPVEEARVAPRNPTERPPPGAGKLTKLEWAYDRLLDTNHLAGLRGPKLLARVCAEYDPKFKASPSSFKTAKRQVREKRKTHPTS